MRQLCEALARVLDIIDRPPYKQEGSEPLLQSPQLASEKTKSKAPAHAVRAIKHVAEKARREEKGSEHGLEARAARKQQV